MGLFFILASIYFIFNTTIISERFTLKANERLKSRKAIQQLFKEGKSFFNSPLRIMYMTVERQPTSLQAGFTVSTRYFKKAVDRNRIKRLMRESYRLQKNRLKTILKQNHKSLSIFFIYTADSLPRQEEMTKKIGEALRKIEKTFE